MMNINEDTEISAEANLEECCIEIIIHRKRKFVHHMDLDYDTAIEFRNKINEEIKKLKLENLTSGCF